MYSTRKDGYHYVCLEDGTIIEESFDGSMTIYEVDGSVEYVSVNGERIIKRVDGSESVYFPDGAYIQWLADGSRMHIDPSGNQMLVTSEGILAESFDRRKVDIERIDGTRVIFLDNEITLVLLPDGTTLEEYGCQMRVLCQPDKPRVTLVEEPQCLVSTEPSMKPAGQFSVTPGVPGSKAWNNLNTEIIDHDHNCALSSFSHTHKHVPRTATAA